MNSPGSNKASKIFCKPGQYKDYAGWVFLDLLIGTSGDIRPKGYPVIAAK
jgi:hypothetical protein